MRELSGLKVCFVAGTLGQGGAERQLYYMLRVLRQHRAEVRVLCLTKGEYWQERIESLGIPVIWVGQSNSRVQRLLAIIRELRRTPPDVLQSQHFYTNIYVAAAARLLGLREVGAIRNNAIDEVGANRGLLGRLSLIGARTVAANSRTGIENAVALGMSRDRLRFLPNTVDISQFKFANERRGGPIRLLTVGRMVQQKRFDRFVRLVAAVRSRTDVPVQGVLVGDGCQWGSLLEQASALHLGQDALDFVGSQADTIPYYRTADVLVLTSDWEGTPNVILEAMASGLPVVATRVGGISDIVLDGRTGYLVDSWDEAGLVNATVDLVENPERRKAYGHAGREFVTSRHAVSRIGFELRQLYDSVMEQPSTMNSS
jgi:glycosyltransferase involved in cell wall biosynthesis